MKILALITGGSLGTLARHFLGRALLQWNPTLGPWATFIVNLSGCFIMGFLFTWVTIKASWSDPLRLFLFTGFLGAYTTFSTFALEGFLFWETKSWLPLFSYLLGSVLLGLLALVLGTYLARWSFG